MSEDELAEFLAESRQDGRLSRGERSALRGRLEGADGPTLDRARSLAVEVAARDLVGPAAKEALGWVEDVVHLLAALDAERSRETVAEVLFSPGDSCVTRIAHLFDGARQRADACVFTVTDDRISSAMTRAAARGVAVRLLTDDDKAVDRGSDVERLSASGVRVAVDDSPAHMHHKFALFDGRLALTGSYNWTRSASEKNEENLLVTDDRRVVEAYQAEFDRLWKTYG